MKLKFANPALLVGRSIVFRAGTLKVTGLDDGVLTLVSGVDNGRGRLPVASLVKCRLYPTHEEVRARYPRLIRALGESLGLTEAEAAAGLHGHLTCGPFFAGTEPMARCGGSANAIRHALRCRYKVRWLAKAAHQPYGESLRLAA